MSQNKTIDMTVGSPAKHLLTFMLPMLLGNLIQQLYNMVDTLIVGNYVGTNQLASVGLCGSTNFLFWSLSSGVSVGIGILVSQAFGAKKENMVKKAIANSFYVLGLSSVVVTIIAQILATPILKILQTKDTLLPDASTYLHITLLGLIAIIFYNGVSAILRALGDSKTPLYFLIASSLMNAGLDIFFVLVLNMGVTGVALATLISQIFSAVTSLAYAIWKFPYFRVQKEDRRPDSQVILQSFRLGAPVAMQNAMIAVSCMVLQGFVNSFGETVGATYTIVGKLEQLVQQPYGSLGMALTTYAGQNIGAGKVDRVKKGFRTATIAALIFSILLIPVAYLFGENIIMIFIKKGDNIADVIAMGRIAIRINALAYFFLGMIYIPRAILNGCGDTGFALINGMTEVICRILFALVLTSIPGIGFWGIWLTTCLTWTVTGGVCVLRYFSGKWKGKAKIRDNTAVKEPPEARKGSPVSLEKISSVMNNVKGRHAV